ncbi:metallophosphoesterase [Alcanivorax sp. 24]|uniref:metallophosphoesterase n=1 Tax=Alcanivorax sp. 24 TaxID=2545266 RepID=UPI0010603EAF|nr:metallophosphoesterase [Alcanivorax sp. 24]
MSRQKLLWITDLHLAGPGSPSPQDVDPLLRLKAVLRDLRDHHTDADRLILTGDLAQSGGVEDYKLLRDVLDDFPVPYRLLVGNHDHRDNLRKVFPDTIAIEGFLQSSEPLGDSRLIYLDTQAQDGHHGEVCPARLAWLETELHDAGSKPALIFMHHPPMTIGVPPLDRLRLRDPDHGLYHLLLGRSAPTQLLFGHLHRNVSGLWAGHPFTGLESTHLPLAFDMAGDRLSRFPGPPAYGVILVENGNIVVNAVQRHGKL